MWKKITVTAIDKSFDTERDVIAEKDQKMGHFYTSTLRPCVRVSPGIQEETMHGIRH